ncbi:MAG: hypothetical protein ACRCTL_12630 [Pseudomonas sp.]
MYLRDKDLIVDMLISPPFIPTPLTGESDKDFLDRAMICGAPGDGGFPLSFDLNWHGGIHLTAPRESDAPLPVCAIADGTVAYFRQPLAYSNDAWHPLNYRNCWTDNGCIVLRHEAEIGEETQVIFYSIYQHLSAIELASPEVGKKVSRKDFLGKAGRIYGTPNRIHFEIISSDVQKIIGRSTSKLDYQISNGRTDSFWGDVYFHLPPEIICYAEQPTNWHDTSNISASLSRPTTSLFIRMHYGTGQCTLSTFTEDGELLGEQHEPQGYEYDLYNTACQRYPDCPSAGYELLRFGRVIGSDELQPTNAAHWRQIVIPSGTAWVNFNATTVTLFSDADFPHWQGWQLIDDDINSDSHCQSPKIREALKLNADGLFPDDTDAISIASSPTYGGLSSEEKTALSGRYLSERQRNTTILNESSNQIRLSRCIFKFQSEWSKNDFDTRYGWLLKVSEGGPIPQESYNKLKLHQQALAFWEDAALDEISALHWHLPPREFISALRACNWLSQSEFKKIYPTSTQGNIDKYLSCINKTLSKYLITSNLRRSHFFGQAGVETNQLLWMSELYNGDPYTYFRRLEKAKNYAGWLGNIKWNDGGNFRGRGMKQLTGRANYSDYWVYRGWIQASSFLSNWWRKPQWWGISGSTVLPTQYSNSPTQDTAAVAQLEATMRPPEISDPELVNNDPSTSIDTAGWFWAKNTLIRVADSNDTAAMTRKIRGDGASVGVTIPWPVDAHFTERENLTKRAMKFIGDYK